MGVALSHQPPPLPVRRFTVEEYRKLGEVGILAEDERVELLEGWIVPKMVHDPPHDNAVEYWIVNLVDRCVECHEQPLAAESVPHYGRVTSRSAGEQVELVLDGRSIASIPVADLLP
ncbi:MAG: hypothetical protein KDK70_33245 [Myxococcales bacterium]|nr:hypothetical protein [Myxococcales bacterium]